MNKELESITTQVVQALKRKNLFITTVESCTGGGIANAITNISGSSEVMKGAFVCYSNEQKVAIGVPIETINKFTVYSEEVSIAMAEAGMRAAALADVSVGVTGSMSRVDPFNQNSHPGTIFVAIKMGDQNFSQKFVFADNIDRWQAKEKVILAVMSMILEILK